MPPTPSVEERLEELEKAAQQEQKEAALDAGGNLRDRVTKTETDIKWIIKIGRFVAWGLGFLVVVSLLIDLAEVISFFEEYFTG